MSSTFNKVPREIEFVARLVEACGVSQPMEVKQLLNISYQGAKNYLDGRIPNHEILIKVSNVTGYSIHWLLTGQGERLVSPRSDAEMPGTPAELRQFVRQVVVEVITEQPEKKESSSRLVQLAYGDVISETVVDAVPAHK